MTDGTWIRIDASSWPVRAVEQTGSSANLWLENPADGTRWLHKDTVIPASGIEQGEDWSEVVSSQVARELGVPHAETRLCIRHGRRGSLSLSVLPSEDYSLNEGTVILERAAISDYVPHSEGKPAVDPGRPEVRRPGHSLKNVGIALKNAQAPPGFTGPPNCAAFDVFAGYMILDALIANRDRHEQNWAVLTPQLLSPPEYLSPTYDHASSLGYNLTNEKRERLLSNRPAMVRWANRGTAWRFEFKSRPNTLVDHAADAVQLCSSEGADWWRDRLDVLDLSAILTTLRSRQIDALSEAAARFADELLQINLRRLRDAICRRPGAT